jgi:hypothetical protein
MVQLGDLEGAAAAFENGATTARARGAGHDAAFCLLGLARIARLRGAHAEGLEDESGAIFERLGIVAVPAFPLAANDEG